MDDDVNIKRQIEELCRNGEYFEEGSVSRFNDIVGNQIFLSLICMGHQPKEARY